MAQTHFFDSRPEHLFWGYFDGTTEAIGSINSGDEVVLDCLPAALPRDLPADKNRVLPSHLLAMETLAAQRGPNTHMMTGPIYIEGAQTGDTLQIDILDITPLQDWGYTAIYPLKGALEEEYLNYKCMHIDIDAEQSLCSLPNGVSLRLDPFFGILCVAPPLEWGRISTSQPRAFGGNMDNKELRKGSKLFLPIFNDGAMFSAGDGHGRQGDGEVCVTALETALQGRFRLTVCKNKSISHPYAETSTHIISMGFDEDLNAAARKALRQMIGLVSERLGITKEEAYILLSLAGDLRVTQVVNGDKGVHMIFEKRILEDS